MPGHVPVLLPDVLSQLQLQPNDDVIDATLGGGGHARALLEATAPNGRLLGLEADARTLEQTQHDLAPYGQRVELVHSNFANLTSVAHAHGFNHVAAVIFDLGLSSIALDDPDRGFSFQHSGSLDMRLDPMTQSTTAAEIINQQSSEELAKLFRELGEERQSERIAQAIVDHRPFESTTQLAELIATVKPRRGRIHPATQVFQALRMAVNDELGVITSALPQAVELLKRGGRLAVITFHSIEDRQVKQWGKTTEARGLIEVITKHVIAPAYEEVKTNPRARSAKLRIYQKR